MLPIKNRIQKLAISAGTLLLSSVFMFSSVLTAADQRPNVVYIMADELGYYEPSFMGNPNIKTPNLDKFAAEGIVFKNMFAGSSVCAPTRCCFLTGKHSGHTSVRANDGGTPSQHEYLYWEINGWIAIRQNQWRAVRPKDNKPWELYDLSSDPSESKDLAAANPQTLDKLTSLAAKAHEPVREGSFASYDRHQRDRRAKFGKQDQADAQELNPKGKAKAR